MKHLVRTAIALLILSGATVATAPAMAQNLGEIRFFAGDYAPRGWSTCDGQILPITQHPDLFNVLGTTYGGDGQTTFALPDLRGRTPVHAGAIGSGQPQPGEEGGNTLNATQGADTPASYSLANNLRGLTCLIFMSPDGLPEDEAFIGEVRFVAFRFAPPNWEKCDGQLLSIARNQALFTILGTTYGGDGQSVFGVPDLRGRSPVHAGAGAGLDSVALGAGFGITDPVNSGSDVSALPTLAVTCIINVFGVYPAR